MTPERAPRAGWGAFAGFGALTIGAVVAANVGAGVARVGTYRWWRSLDKPPYTPPDPVIPAVWNVMYALAALSAARVWRAPPSAARRRALERWGVQLALNGLWTRLFFGQRRPDRALVDSAALFAGAVAYARAAGRVDRTAERLMLPYLGWVGFATVLNADLAARNPTPGAAPETPSGDAGRRPSSPAPSQGG